MKLNRLLFGIGLALVLTGQALHARLSDADTNRLATLRAKADNGEADAQSKLAEAYFIGSLGLAKNEVEAVKWYRKAAEQNQASVS